MSGTNRAPRQRSDSWMILDFAMMIQFPIGMYAARILLWFLAKAGKHGYSYHGYGSIRAHTGLSKDGVSRALKYLRDELRILTWESGGGGPIRKETNHYQLHLEAMKEVISEQGVFDPETGKMLAHSRSFQAGRTIEAASPDPVVSADLKSSLLRNPIESSQQTEILSNQHSVESTEHDLNIYGSLYKSNSNSNANTNEYGVSVDSADQTDEISLDVDSTHDRLGLEKICLQLQWDIGMNALKGIHIEEQKALFKKATEKLKNLRCPHTGCREVVDFPGDVCLTHYRPPRPPIRLGRFAQSCAAVSDSSSGPDPKEVPT